MELRIFMVGVITREIRKLELFQSVLLINISVLGQSKVLHI